MTFGDVIGGLIQWLIRLFPAVKHLECIDIGVTITRGKKVRVRKPGMFIIWPLWTAYYFRPANTQTVILPPQALTTSDGKEVVAGGMCRYEFDRDTESVRNALVETVDVERSIVDEALAIFCDFINTSDWDALSGTRTAVNRSLTTRLGTRLKLYGVNVGRAQLTDLCPCITLNHMGLQRISRQAYQEEEE